MKVRISDPSKTRLLVCTALFLAYQGCGGTTGMGALQARNGVTAENVAEGCGERPVNYPNSEKGMTEIYGDYIFGRMCKVGYKFHSDTGDIIVSDNTPRPDYQGWSGKTYPTYLSLLEAAARQVGVTLSPVV